MQQWTFSSFLAHTFKCGEPTQLMTIIRASVYLVITTCLVPYAVISFCPHNYPIFQERKLRLDKSPSLACGPSVRMLQRKDVNWSLLDFRAYVLTIVVYMPYHPSVCSDLYINIYFLLLYNNVTGFLRARHVLLISIM